AVAMGRREQVDGDRHVVAAQVGRTKLVSPNAAAAASRVKDERGPMVIEELFYLAGIGQIELCCSVVHHAPIASAAQAANQGGANQCVAAGDVDGLTVFHAMRRLPKFELLSETANDVLHAACQCECDLTSGQAGCGFAIGGDCGHGWILCHEIALA